MNGPMHYIHQLNFGKSSSAPYLCGAMESSASTERNSVTCPDCRRLLDQRTAKTTATPVSEEERKRREWTVAVVGGDTDVSFEEWKRKRGSFRPSGREIPLTLAEFNRAGVGTPTPRHKPPMINEFDAGIFEFYDVDWFADGQLCNRSSLEVVPQTTGNVEITINSMGNDSMLFTLSHLDRADLLRALLHDFHYSPERGGPNED